MTKYSSGDRVELHIVGTVEEVNDEYCWVRPDSGSGRWTVEYDDPEWHVVSSGTIQVDVPDELLSTLVAHAVEEGMKLVAPKPPARTQRELELESALIEAVDSMCAMHDNVHTDAQRKYRLTECLNESIAELERLQAMP